MERNRAELAAHISIPESRLAVWEENREAFFRWPAGTLASENK